jgi:hypothetical protein
MKLVLTIVVLVMFAAALWRLTKPLRKFTTRAQALVFEKKILTHRPAGMSYKRYRKLQNKQNKELKKALR